MKKLVSTCLMLIGLFFLFSCSQQAKPDETAALKAENLSLSNQIEVLNEKVMSLSTEASSMNQSKMENALTYTNLIKDLQEQVNSNESTITSLENRLKVTFVSDIFFDEGSDVIKPGGRKALNNLLKTLTSVKGKLIRVEGYTDNIPIAPVLQVKFPSNWELSTARADAVVRYLIEKGIKPEMIKSAGYGKFNPVAFNETAEGRAKNKRIEVELVSMDARGKFK